MDAVTRILVSYGVIFTMVMVVLIVVFIGTLISTVRRERKSKLGTLYFKNGAFGSRTFRIDLNTDLADVKEGEKYVVTVKEEKATDVELQAIHEIEDDI